MAATHHEEQPLEAFIRQASAKRWEDLLDDDEEEEEGGSADGLGRGSSGRSEMTKRGPSQGWQGEDDAETDGLDADAEAGMQEVSSRERRASSSSSYLSDETFEECDSPLPLGPGAAIFSFDEDAALEHEEPHACSRQPAAPSSPVNINRTKSVDFTDTRDGALDPVAPDTLELVTELTKSGKRAADFAFVDECRAGLEAGNAPVVVDAYSAGGCYYLRGTKGLCAIFKPVDEEPGSPKGTETVAQVMRHGVRSGEGYLREVAAFLLDHGGFAGVPPTAMVRVFSRAWGGGAPSLSAPPAINRFASLSMDSPSGSMGWSIPESVSAQSASKPRLASSGAVQISPLNLPPIPCVQGRTLSVSMSRSQGPRSCCEPLTLRAGSAGSPLGLQAISILDEPSDLPFKLGSAQAYVSHHSSAEDIGSGLMPLDGVQRIGVLDIRLLNLDRHGGNILLQTVASAGSSARPGSRGRYSRRSESFCGGSGEGGSHAVRLVPIDHGLCLPRLSQLSAAGDADFGEEADVITLEWMAWPQSREPFLPHVLEYIRHLDAEADVALLEQALCGGLGPEELLGLRASTTLLQHMAALRYSLHDIGRVVQSGQLRALVDEAGLEGFTGAAQEVEGFMGRFRSALMAAFPGA